MRIVLGSLKGGVGKTTSAAYIGLGLARHGRTLIVDGDPRQQSLLTWADSAGDAWPSNCSVVAIAGQNIGRRIDSLASDYEYIVVDTGPKNPLELRGALSVSDQLIVPAAPRALDLAELPSTFAVATEVEAIRSVSVAVLLTQVRASTRAASDVRTVFAERDIPTFRGQIGLREQYVGSYGSVPDDLGEYAYIVEELLNGEE